MCKSLVLLVALFALSAVAKPFGVMDTINGSVPIGTLSANKWNQTSLTFNPAAAGVPITSIWFYFADINTAKPLPSTIFQRGSITLSTSNMSLSVYNALTDSLNVPRVFPATYPLLIPTGTLTLKASWALNIGQPSVSATLSWMIAVGDRTALYAQHANMMVASWSSTGLYSSSVTAALPYDGLLVWAVGNVLSGGSSVVIQNNSTGTTICTSAVSASGDMQPCAPNAQIPQGTKLTVTVHANGTFTPNAGGADLYIVKVPPPPTTTTTTSHATTAGPATTGTHTGTTAGPATTATHGGTSAGPATTATHGDTSAGPATHGGTSAGPATHGGTSAGPSTHGGSSGPASSGPSSHGGSSSDSGTSGGQSTGASSTTSSVSMGYSSGSSGSGSSGGGEGFVGADVDSIFVQKFQNKKTKIVINDVKERDNQQVLDIAEIDELPSADPDHFRFTEEKASNKFL